MLPGKVAINLAPSLFIASLAFLHILLAEEKKTEFFRNYILTHWKIIHRVEFVAMCGRQN